ncbi:MAG TPA: sugar ABC transporter permease [Acidimicrobiales bacterium]|nr:sugar ABC transporter permease [Acidimicrobiales bacterium]
MAPPRHRQPRVGLADRDRFLAGAMLLPAVAYILVLVGVPFFLAIAYSVSDVSTGDPSYDFVGLDQYRTVVGDRIFRRALGNTLLFTGVSMVLIIVLARGLAAILMAKFRGKWLFRFLVLLPWTTPVALGAVSWLWLLDSLFSPLDWVLREIGVLGPNGHTIYLGKPALAMASVIAVHTWRLVPLSAVIMMAGLSAIPPEVRDAAQVDGAGPWRTFREITLPLTMPVVAVAGLFSAIITFTDMSVVRVLTNGGPLRATEVLSSWAYTKGIGGGDLGQGAAIALFLFPLLLAAAIAILRAVRRMEVL